MNIRPKRNRSEAATAPYTVTRKMAYGRGGRRTRRRHFATARGALNWLRKDLAAKGAHRCPRTGQMYGRPCWTLRERGTGEVLRVDSFGHDRGLWA